MTLRAVVMLRTDEGCIMPPRRGIVTEQVGDKFKVERFIGNFPEGLYTREELIKTSEVCS